MEDFQRVPFYVAILPHFYKGLHEICSHRWPALRTRMDPVFGGRIEPHHHLLCQDQSPFWEDKPCNRPEVVDRWPGLRDSSRVHTAPECTPLIKCQPI